MATTPSIKQRLHQWAGALKTNLQALYLCSKHPEMPWPAYLIAIIVIANALSPVDLIPDFIPVIGYLDDLLLLPAGIWLAIYLIPDPLWQSCREKALAHPIQLPENRTAAIIVVLCWLALLSLLLWLWLGSN